MVRWNTLATGKAISRRRVLRGFGAVLALPCLDAMTPAFSVFKKAAAAATTAQNVGRFVIRADPKIDVIVAFPAIDQLGDNAHPTRPAEADRDFSPFGVDSAFDDEIGHEKPRSVA